MGKYLLDNVHAQYPQARCAIVVASRAVMIRDLLRGYPWIEVIEANRKSPRALFNLWKEWRGSDLVVTQYAGKPGGRFSLLSKIMARLVSRRGGLVGFGDPSFINAYLYDQIIPLPHSHSPAQDERLALRALGHDVIVPYPVLQNIHEGALEKFGLASGRYVLVHLFSGSTKRGLHPDKRRALVAALKSALPPGVIIVLTGAKKERDEAAAAALGERVLAGEASLQETIELVSAAAAVVSLDTGVAHIAAQLDVPVAVISTCMGLWWWNEEQYGPQASFEVFTVALHAIAEHVLEDYPTCQNNVDPAEVARMVQGSIEKK